jgi:hypothetical protein
MNDIDDLIKYENENTSLDFKTIQYLKDKFEDLIKDIVSMANADSISNKYIIIGINHKSNGDRDIVGIREDFVDDAIYQQLINDNVEPELTFKYFPYQIGDKKVGIIQIINSDNPPYMLKKDYGKLRKGDCFIRKGSHQSRLTRTDLDKIFDRQNNLNQFKGNVDVLLIVNSLKSTEIKAIEDLIFPSDEKADKIRRIIQEKEQKYSNIKGDVVVNNFFDMDIPMIGGTPYKNRSIATLKNNLENIKETYLDDDLYYLFEEKSRKINFELINTGEEYLEDCSVEIKITKPEKGLLIAEKIYEKPNRSSSIFAAPIIKTKSWKSQNYPKVIINDTDYMIQENIGNLRHLIPQEILKVPIRFYINETFVDNDIVFNVRIFGKNLKNPIEKSLLIKVK